MKLKLMIISAAATAWAAAGPLPDGPAAGKVPGWLDTNGDGVVTELEAQAFAEARKDAVGDLLDDLDTDGNGSIGEEERQAAIDALKAKQQERLTALFEEVAGEDGEVSLEDFTTVVPGNIPAPTVAILFGLLNTDGGDTITIDEFLGFFGGDAPELPTIPGGPPSLP